MGEELDEIRFGTSGVRGLAPQLLAGGAENYVAAFCQMLRVSHPSVATICIARDLRYSSEALAEICAAIAAAAGFAPEYCGAIPTPALALYAMARGGGAIMVTGSHIPADRNGLKFYTPEGEITKTDEAAIVAAVGKLANGTPPRSDRQVLQQNRAAASRYLDRNGPLAKTIDLAGRHIGVWSHSSVAADPLARLLGQTGARVTVFGRSDGFVAVDTEAVSVAAQSQLREFAAREKPDAIVSADADGDRPLLADGDGEILPGDLVAFSAALALGAKSLATPVTSNSAIELQFVGEVRRTRIGSPYVLATMQTLASEGLSRIVGFEANGGLMTRDPLDLNGRPIEPLATRDAALPLLAVLSRLANRDFDLRTLGAFHRFRPARSDRIVDFPQACSQRLLRELGKRPQLRNRMCGGADAVELADSIDGLAMRLSNGQTLRIRASGNAPELRLYAEAESLAEATRMIESAAAWAMEFRDAEKRQLLDANG